MIPSPSDLTAQQEKQLKQKRYATRHQSEEEKWREVYRILFPGESIPSPCEFGWRDHAASTRLGYNADTRPDPGFETGLRDRVDVGAGMSTGPETCAQAAVNEQRIAERPSLPIFSYFSEQPTLATFPNHPETPLPLLKGKDVQPSR